ncbi:type IV secretion system DNA-binding domain-containing protein [Actinomadura rupiterrae]|uniref:type IV secretion system DNA-binding domain-containing protein n=1 Tax=Actinomadura rupiterrae TaxID=559627 RepID=UPI0020A48547|nr:type IV secretion system DNA-binding domain-containing protein [Actinomadura rupiterrae]MCP2342003.1 hypothetical protein [Actinomadura rupiterrae]
MTPPNPSTWTGLAAWPKKVPPPPTDGISNWLIKWIDKFTADPAHLPMLAMRYGAGLVAGALLLAVVFATARTLLRRWRHDRHAEGARVIEVAVPAQVEPSSALTWWSRLVGLTSPEWKRLLLGQPHLAWEYIADRAGVRIQIWVPGTIPAALVEKTLQGAWPGVTLTSRPADRPVPVDAATAGGRLVLARPDHFPLETAHQADPLRHLLAAASDLGRGEHLVVQFLTRPVVGRRLKQAWRAAATLRGGRSAAPQAALFDAITPGMTGHPNPGELTRMYPERAEQVAAIMGKARFPRYEVQIAYSVATTRGPQQARSWLRSAAHEIASTFALFTSAHQHLNRKRLPRAGAALATRRLGRGFLLSAPELAAMAHLPYDLYAPGVTRAGARPVAPSPAVPSGGARTRLLGDSDARPARPVGIPVASARQHTHVLGSTGTGKSTFLAGQILADAHAGRGALVIDPKGDLIVDVLDRLPERAIDQTVVFDPIDQTTPPPCINVLAGQNASFAADAIVTTFRRCFSSAWGPRLDDLLRSACLTLAHVQGPNANLGEVPKLLSDAAFRTRITTHLTDEHLASFWTSYEELSPGGRAALVAPVMNKLRAVLLRPFVKSALSGSAPTVNLGHALNTGGLILARLPKGVLGDDAARLFGSLLLAQTWQALLPRARWPEDSRPDATAYVDEAHNFLNLPGSISDVLAEARAYRFAMVIAHQHLSQLPKDLREAVSSDARNKVYFAASPEDAGELVRHVAPELGAHDLSHLGAYQAAGRIVLGSASSPGFTFRTRPLPDPISGRAEAVREASRRQFGGEPQRPSATRKPTVQRDQRKKL